MKTTKKTLVAILFGALALSAIGLDANALAPVTKASRVTVVTTTNSAKLSWLAFPKGKVSSIKLVALTGSTKIVKTLPAKTTTFRFTELRSNTNYTFSITGVLGARSSAAVTVKAKTKFEFIYNAIFFGQPQDMVVGDGDQELFAFPNGGPMVFSTTTPTTCSIVNDVFLRAIAMGDCTVIAANPGDSQYAPAESEVRTLTISTPIGQISKTLLWSEEFSGAAGSGPDSANWDVTVGDGCGTAAGCGWGNNESESYAVCANKQDGSEQGVMVITASTPTGDPNCRSNKTWTSGKFTTFGKQHFTYGYFEARMKMPAGEGTWPAFWTLGSNINSVPWPRSGELDIMEYAGSHPNRSTSAVHYANASGSHEYKSGAMNGSVDLSEDFHTYGMLWLPNEVTFTFDGRPTFVLKKSQTGLTVWPFGPTSAGVHPKMYIILNLAMGGNYGGTIDSSLRKATFSIDYVRYYSVDGYGSAPTN